MSKKKSILIVTNHPAQVHNFKNIRDELIKKKYEIYWLATEKDVSKQLLETYKITYEVLEKPKGNFLPKLLVLLKNNLKVYKLLKKNEISIAITRVSPYVTFALWLRGIPHLGISDTETSGFYDTVFSKFLSALLTAESFKRRLRKDQITFQGNIELFYLHPNRFKESDDIFDYLGIEKGQSYVICRFVSWNAYHDKGISGFTNENKVKAVQELSRHAKVFITSEKKLPPDLEPYRISIPPEKMHDALAHATLFFGESGTMASESAVLGKPAIFLDKHGRGYTDEEGEYGLVFNFTNSEADQISAIEKSIELLKRETLDQEIKDNHERFMSDKIDMTAFLVWFIENWPESKNIMLEKPEYQSRFK